MHAKVHFSCIMGANTLSLYQSQNHSNCNVGRIESEEVVEDFSEPQLAQVASQPHPTLLPYSAITLHVYLSF